MLPDRGFLLIDKPAGISSFDVIRRLRKITGIRRAGHCGTLDPFATGLLICSLGPYTRLNTWLEARDKSYEATLLLGQSTSTGDPEGEVVKEQAVDLDRIDPSLLRETALQLQELPIPAYSAVKIDGQRAYALARAGKAVEIAARPTRIYNFEVTSVPRAGEELPLLDYRCRVSKGTYIRSLSEWIASQLGTVGHTVQLRRTAIGDILVNDAVRLEDLSPETWHRHITKPRKLFSDLEAWNASPDAIAILNNGQSLAAEGPDNPVVIVFGPDSEVAGVASRQSGRLHPKVNLK